MDIDPHTIELIHQDLRGHLTAEQKSELKSWLNRTAENHLVYEQYKKVYSRVYEVDTYQRVDVVVAWERLSSQISSPKIKFPRWKQFVALAAVITIMAVVSIALWLTDSSEKVDELTHLDKVVIQTEQGIIEVDSLDELEIIDLKGARLSKGNNQVVYTSELQTKKSELNTLVVPRGNEYSLTLADGTQLMVNAESKVIFPTVFTDDERRIVLESGEIFLNVAHNANQPFIVNAKGVDIEVLGTRFNVDAYGDSEFLKVTLEEGKVQVASADSDIFSFKPVEIIPGQQLAFDYENKKMQLIQVDVSMTTAWTRGEYYFENESLESIMLTLSRWYDCDVVFEKSEHKSITYSGRVRKYEDVHNFLQALEAIEGLKFEIKENQIVIK